MLNRTTFLAAVAGSTLAAADSETPLTPTVTPTPPAATASFFWGDYDADGLDDVFAITADGSARLLKNSGDGTFDDVTLRTGVAPPTGVHTALWADFNGDQKLDLFLAAFGGESRLLEQSVDGTFFDATETAGLASTTGVLSAEWVDYDADGRLDLHLATLNDDALYHNAGEGQFQRVELGLEPRIPFTDGRQAWRSAQPGLGSGAGGGNHDAGSGGGATSGPPSGSMLGLVICASSIDDMAMPGSCISASSVPTMGMLYPLSNDWYIDSATGRVGIGTTSPGAQLDVSGELRASDTITSTKASGAPFAITSSTMNANLNADLLDGFHASDFSQLGNSIETAEISDGAILNSKLASEAVTSSKVLDGTLTAADLATNSVGSNEIGSNAVGSSEIAANAVGTSELAPDSVTTSEILDGTITAADLAAGAATPGPNSIGSAEVIDNSLTAADLAPNSVSASELAGNSVSSAKIIDNSIGSVDLGSNSVGSSEIASGAVGTAEVADNSLTASDLAANSVGSSEIATSAVGTAEVADNSLTSADLAANSVGASEIATAAVGSLEVADGSLTSADLATNSVGASEIATSAVGTSEVADNSLTANDLATSSVTTSEIANNTIEYFDIASPMDGTSAGALLWVQNDTTLSQGKAIQAETSASGGVALEALALNTGNGVSYGVKGLSSSAFGYGVWGRTNGTSSCFGVFGETFSGSGVGVHGENNATSGTAYGVRGRSDSSGGIGVLGETTNTGGNFTMGVRGVSAATSGTNYGVRAESASTSGRALYSLASATTGTNYGVRGQSSSSSGYGVYSVGDMGASGTKSFIQPHPTDASKQIRFVCLEGNESGTYFRGSSSLVGGIAVIEVPEEFRNVSESENITVQVTAMGPSLGLWVESKGLDRIVVRGERDVEFDYFVNGVRRGFANIDLVRDNVEFVPSVKGVPFGTQYPKELRDVLVGNGILNPDYTPNEATAAAMGWFLVEPESELAQDVER